MSPPREAHCFCLQAAPLPVTLRPMSWLLATIYDPFMKNSEEAYLREWRVELLRGLSGEVLEIGAGTGANLSLYPAAVSRLVVTEPDRHMFTRLDSRLTKGGAKTDVSAVMASSDALPFSEGTFDAVVSTLVLCSVADVKRTLREVKRVLRPGGKFVYLEHVAAEEGSPRGAWQHRLEPFWKRIAGNCHLTRDTGSAIREGGFFVEEETKDSMRKALSVVRPSIRGVARRE